MGTRHTKHWLTDGSSTGGPWSRFCSVVFERDRCNLRSQSEYLLCGSVHGILFGQLSLWAGHDTDTDFVTLTGLSTYGGN